jgi:hypothetical protein
MKHFKAEILYRVWDLLEYFYSFHIQALYRDKNQLEFLASKGAQFYPTEGLLTAEEKQVRVLLRPYICS